MLHHRRLLLARRCSTTCSRDRRKGGLRAATELTGARWPQGEAGELPSPGSVARGSSAARGAPSGARRPEMVRPAADRSRRSSRSICSRKRELRRRSGRSICSRKSGSGKGLLASVGGAAARGDFLDRITEESDKEEKLGPLHDAASKGKMDTCQHLVENLGFDVNIPANDGSGKSPLACSVSCGKVIAVRYLLHKGADLNKQDVMGFTPLHYAAKQGYDGIARLLLSRGANVDVNSSEGTPLHLAAAHGKVDVMQMLLEHHADPDRVSPDHCTPLAAVLCATNEKVNVSGCLKCMNLLVKAGADLNSMDPDTPLVIATSKGLSKCVDYLLEAGADANIPIKDGGKKPIEIAAKSGRRGLVESLLPFTSPIRTVSDWSVEGIIAYARSIPTKDKGQESDEDSNIQQNLRDGSVVGEDAGASKAGTKDKLSDDDKKAQLKLHGGKAVSRMDYAGASKFYTEAIMLDPADATLYSNRSFCHLKIGEKNDALVDANACISLRPEWPKGYYRKGAVYMSLKEYKEARDAFMDGLKLDPSNLDIQNAYWEADEAMIKKHSAGQSVWPFA